MDIFNPHCTFLLPLPPLPPLPPLLLVFLLFFRFLLVFHFFLFVFLPGSPLHHSYLNIVCQVMMILGAHQLFSSSPSLLLNPIPTPTFQIRPQKTMRTSQRETHLLYWRGGRGEMGWVAALLAEGVRRGGEGARGDSCRFPFAQLRILQTGVEVRCLLSQVSHGVF